jgi:hypothetical protein
MVTEDWVMSSKGFKVIYAPCGLEGTMRYTSMTDMMKPNTILLKRRKFGTIFINLIYYRSMINTTVMAKY